MHPPRSILRRRIANAPPRRLAVHWPANQIEPELSRLFGTRLRRTAPQQSGEMAFVVASRSGQSAVLRVDPAGHGVFVLRTRTAGFASGAARRGPGRFAAALGQRRCGRLRCASPIRKKCNARSSSIGSGPSRASGTQLAQAAQPPAASPPPAAAATTPSPTAADASDTEQTNQRLRELGLDLNIEVLPELDAIILRGSNRDVNEVLRIIEDIERISAEAVPEVEVVPLEHASSEALAPLLTTIEPDLLAGRPGKVSITAAQQAECLAADWPGRSGQGGARV